MRGFLLLALVSAFTLASATPAYAKNKKGHHKTAKTSELYERLGGKKGIATVVDNFVGKCAADSRINSFFAKTASNKKRLAKFKGNLVAQICEAVGGPCKYKGMSMKKAHRGMGVKEEHFNALVEDLVATLDEAKVAEADKQAILGVLGPMKNDIIGGGRNTASEHHK